MQVITVSRKARKLSQKTTVVYFQETEMDVIKEGYIGSVSEALAIFYFLTWLVDIQVFASNYSLNTYILCILLNVSQ